MSCGSMQSSATVVVCVFTPALTALLASTQLPAKLENANFAMAPRPVSEYARPARYGLNRQNRFMQKRQRFKWRPFVS